MNEVLFYDKLLQKESDFHTLSEEENHHLVNVLRIKKGQEIFITNGYGLIARGILYETFKNKSILRIIEVNEYQTERPFIHAGICLLKSRERMEWMIEKLTELGINAITLIESARSERQKVNFPRIEKIMISAIKQSFRAFLPEIQGPVKLKEFLFKLKEFDGQKLVAVCGTSKDKHLSCIYQRKNKITYLIGPEGDFTREELTDTYGNGFAAVSLGKERLRSETAAVYFLSVIKTLNYL